MRKKNKEKSIETTSVYGIPQTGIRRYFYTVIFEAETPAGLYFDLFLIAAILVSVLVVILDSVQAIHQRYDALFNWLEWFFTILFTVEYLVRLYCVQRPLRYTASFFGVIDLLSILPTYLTFFIPGVYVLLDVRILRLIRIFRVLKLTSYIAEYSVLAKALRASARKILIFLSIIVMIVILMGTLMYVIEGPRQGYNNIPTGIYWAIVTMTTVGYGDVVPHTELGKFIAALMMLLGWGILAVPTGIVTTEMALQSMEKKSAMRTCQECLSEGHEMEAKYCKDCGAALVG